MTAKQAGKVKKMDTPVFVYNNAMRKARKMDDLRQTKNRKMSKFFSKKAVLPLEKE